MGTKKPEKPKYYVISFSGGKDSTALALEYISRHKDNPVEYPLDEIVHCDTGMEFPGMYEHIEKCKKFFDEQKVTFTTLRPPKSFEYLLLERPCGQRSSKIPEGAKGYGWPASKFRWCTSKLKEDVINAFLREKRKVYDIVMLTGIAVDETSRLEKAYAKKTEGSLVYKFPLAEWGWTEKECLQYCYGRGFDWGGLYKIFNRVSCWCCPLSSLPELRNLYNFFPDLWAKLKYLDGKSRRKFRDKTSVRDLEIRFELEKERESQGLPIRNKEFFMEWRQRCADEPTP